MPRYRLDIEYEGTRYRGWQVQPDVRTVQGEILKALQDFLQQTPVEFKGAGRTDAGVHALAQTAHLEIKRRVPPLQLTHEINDRLPSDINILRVQPAPPKFHARHDAVRRSYLYQIARRRTAFGKRFVWWLKDKLDTVPMHEAATLFHGMHDMRSFTAVREGETRVRIEEVKLVEAGALLLIRLQASHFLWKMVRQMVGVLVEVGRGRLSVADVRRFLRELSNAPAEFTAPPSGLFLEHTWYPGESPESSVQPTFSLPWD
ncbi:MAG TPA: tRNA pseudouridine(38-40) synthase TruA [Candidatus Xenobia bacterium]|jgi:tRNA pseudouridine38-40 synthase